MKNDKLDILLQLVDDIPHWLFCKVLAMLQWNAY